MNMLCADAFEFDRDQDRWEPALRRNRRVGESEFSKGWTKLLVLRRPTLALKPTATYARRSAHLRKLRTESAWLAQSTLEDVTQPTGAALTAAESFINRLDEGCLDFSLELSHDGEINFLYGEGHALFHIHIGEEGVLSYYSRLSDAESFGDDLSASTFPHVLLQEFIEQAK